VGATILTWNDNLYISPLAILDGTKAIRGGIPLVFPWFGKPTEKTQQHGFARNLKWKYVIKLNCNQKMASHEKCTYNHDFVHATILAQQYPIWH